MSHKLEILLWDITSAEFVLFIMSISSVEFPFMFCSNEVTLFTDYHTRSGKIANHFLITCSNLFAICSIRIYFSYIQEWYFLTKKPILFVHLRSCKYGMNHNPPHILVAGPCV